MTAVASPPTPGGLAFFADRFAVDARLCDALLSEALARGGDYADLFFQHEARRTLSVEEGRVHGTSAAVVQGLAVRVVQGDAVGLAATECLDAESMRRAARAAAAIAAGGGATSPRSVRPVDAADAYPVATLPGEEPAEAGLALLRRVDAAARAVAPSISDVQVRLGEETRRIAVATSEGCLVGDVQPMVRLLALALSARGDDRQRGWDSRAFRADLDIFVGDGLAPETIGRRAAERAVLGHEAVEAPAGFLPVVLAPGDSGVLIHEAVGHGLEADFNRKRLSNFTGRIGERVASPLCTVVDDGTIPRLHGTINVDDEGRAAQRNVLIENGILRGYLHDWISARHFGVSPSGNGRRQDFREVPMPRMTTTFLLAGDSTPDEIVRAVDRGIYCCSFSGGQVNISTGDYVFSTEEAYLIEGGRVTAPIRTTNLIGNGPDSLTRVTMVGHDLGLDQGAGMCGKNGQFVPVSDGLPTVLVDGITVGGTAQ